MYFAMSHKLSILKDVLHPFLCPMMEEVFHGPVDYLLLAPNGYQPMTNVPCAPSEKHNSSHELEDYLEEGYS